MRIYNEGISPIGNLYFNSDITVTIIFFTKSVKNINLLKGSFVNLTSTKIPVQIIFT